MISILEGIVSDGGRCNIGSYMSGTYEQVTSKMHEKVEKNYQNGKTCAKQNEMNER